MARGRPTLAFTPLLLLFLAVLQALGLTPIYQILEALDCPQLALYGMKEEFGIVSNHPKGVLIFEKDFDATKLDTQVCLVLDGGDFKGLVWSHEVKMVIWIRRDLLPSKFEVPMNIPLIIVEVSNKGKSSVEEEIFSIVRTIIQKFIFSTNLTSLQSKGLLLSPPCELYRLRLFENTYGFFQSREVLC